MPSRHTRRRASRRAAGRTRRQRGGIWGWGKKVEATKNGKALTGVTTTGSKVLGAITSNPLTRQMARTFGDLKTALDVSENPVVYNAGKRVFKTKVNPGAGRATLEIEFTDLNDLNQKADEAIKLNYGTVLGWTGTGVKHAAAATAAGIGAVGYAAGKGIYNSAAYIHNAATLGYDTEVEAARKKAAEKRQAARYGKPAAPAAAAAANNNNINLLNIKH